MLLIEAVKNITIYGEPKLFAMIVDESTGYAQEMEFADLSEAQSFVDGINVLVTK
jgi:hypothetical protein